MRYLFLCLDTLVNTSILLSESQVLLTVAIMWVICFILTVTDTVPPGNPIRTDLKVELVQDAAWIKFPYPCKENVVVILRMWLSSKLFMVKFHAGTLSLTILPLACCEVQIKNPNYHHFQNFLPYSTFARSYF